MFRSLLRHSDLRARPAAVRPAWWSRTRDELAREVGCDPGRGLDDAEVERRRRIHGPNTLEPERRPSWLGALLDQLRSPLVLLLVVAAVISAVAREWTDAVVVVSIVLGSAMLGTFHEYRASAAVEKLRAQVLVRATVLRNGVFTQLPAAAIVPGDVVRLGAGSLVPGDAVLLETKDLFVAEAALTGESFPIEKEVGVSGADASVAERRGAVFLGSSVQSGTGLALVVATARATELGAIAHRLATRAPESAFESGIRRFGALLMRVMALLTFVVLAANLLLARPAIESLLFAIALAVGISPEMLPAILAVTLSRGAVRMAERGVIVKRLAAIEGLGAMDVLCTDKTGTLTEGVVRLDGALDASGHPSDEVLGLALVNATLQAGMPNPLDAAIREGARMREVDLGDATKCDEIPYDFARKRLGVVVARGPDRTLVVKGALRSVLDVCTTVVEPSGRVGIDARRGAIDARLDAWNAKGFRVLGVATKTVDAKERYDVADESGLALRGFLLFFDAPKADAEATVRALEALGIGLKVLTGDSRGCAVHVASAVGIPVEGVLVGSELAGLGPEALAATCERTTIFAELDPAQKERVILALAKRGHVVGYLGDGINDAPALHAADVAISVDGAADVAKEAADFVLGRRDLDVLRAGVEAGRVTFANTLKYVRTTVSANFGNMVSMAFASAWLPFLPLAAGQILLNNFLSDVPQTFIASDAVDPEVTARPGRWNVRAIRDFMVVFGLVSSAFDILTFVALRYASATLDEFRTAWFVESLLTELGIALVVRTSRPAYRSRPARALVLSTGAVTLVALLSPYLPYGSTFGLVPLEPRWIVLITTIAALYLVASEVTKRLYVRFRSFEG